MADLVVGCPVSSRAWILPRWFEHVREACDLAGMRPTFAFVGAPTCDLDTFAVIDAEIRRGGEAVQVIDSGEDATHPGRYWTPARYEHMAAMRNRLLAAVRRLKPTYFLSLDSDILLHRDALKNLVESCEKWDAVGGRCYMTPSGLQWPSYGMFKPGGGIRRNGDGSGVFKVDCIMAIKLMKAWAYWVDYAPHSYGEDIGWSRACKDGGVKLGWDGRCISKHVVEPEMLATVDPRLGW